MLGFGPGHFNIIMNRKDKGKRKSNSQRGQSALSKMIKNSTDQMVGFARERYTGRSAPANIARDLNLIRKVLNVERKQVDSFITATTVTQGSSLVSNITGPAQGTSGAQRDGDSIKVVRVDAVFKFGYGTGTTNGTASQIFNYYLVRWEKTPTSSGSTPFGIGDYLLVDGQGQFTPLSLPNNDLAENFVTLLCGSVTVKPNFGTAVNNVDYEIVPISHECSFHQTFTGAAASTVVDKALFWVITASEAANTGGSSVIQASTRLWYVDN